MHVSLFSSRAFDKNVNMYMLALFIYCMFSHVEAVVDNSVRGSRTHNVQVPTSGTLSDVLRRLINMETECQRKYEELEDKVDKLQIQISAVLRERKFDNSGISSSDGSSTTSCKL